MTKMSKITIGLCNVTITTDENYRGGKVGGDYPNLLFSDTSPIKGRPYVTQVLFKWNSAVRGGRG